jgi:hypothetical protein
MAKSTYIISIVSFNKIGRSVHEQIGTYEKKKLIDHEDASLILNYVFSTTNNGINRIKILIKMYNNENIYIIIFIIYI